MTTKQPTCAERVEEHWKSRKADLEALWRKEAGQSGPFKGSRCGIETNSSTDCLGDSCIECEGDDCELVALAEDEVEGELNEYGLCFDYVAPDTFSDQPEAFWRYQLSTGGPGDELRFFASTHDSRCYRIEYWFLDWFDGASIDITREQIALDLWDWFKDAGSTEHTQREALS